MVRLLTWCVCVVDLLYREYGSPWTLPTVRMDGEWLSTDSSMTCSPHSMHILPQPHSEDGVFYRHEAGIDSHIEYSMVDKPNPDTVSLSCVLGVVTTPYRWCLWP